MERDRARKKGCERGNGRKRRVRKKKAKEEIREKRGNDKERNGKS